MTASMKQKRSKRFERMSKRDAAALHAHFQLTERDETIIRRVGEFRFLNSGQIMRLLPPVSGDTPKQIPERLKRLWQLQYLDRPRAQLEYYRRGGGSARMVYALGLEGAKFLSERDGTPIHKLNWTLKNKRVGQLNILHTIEIADVQTRLECECGANDQIELIKAAQLISESPAATQAMEKPHKIVATPTITVERKNRATGTITREKQSFRLAVHPDDVFALAIGGDKQSNFFVEIDRGTMPVWRKASSMSPGVRQRSVLEKMLCYAQAWKDGHVLERYGWTQFRVIFVTPSPERVARMLQVLGGVAQDISGCKGLFLFADAASLHSTSILDFRFTNGKGEHVRLID